MLAVLSVFLHELNFNKIYYVKKNMYAIYSEAQNNLIMHPSIDRQCCMRPFQSFRLKLKFNRVYKICTNMHITYRVAQKIGVVFWI